MNQDLTALLELGHGLVTRAQAIQVVPVWVVERACRGGHLHRILPGVYRGTAYPLTAGLRRRAAVAWLAGRGALSHTSALAVWGLHEPTLDEPVHLAVPGTIRLRGHPGFEIHRRLGFAPEPPHAVVRDGQPVTPLDRSLVDAWPLLAPTARRHPVIRAVNDRLTTAGRLHTTLQHVPKLPGRAELRDLIGLLAAGCRSPLEIFGHEHVFSYPGMPEFQRQLPVRLGTRTVYLDVYAEREMVNFELDGASVHGNSRQREIDLRRDAQLAGLGVLVVRFTHRRLVYETAAVRQEILAILARRRAVLRS